MLKPNRPVLPIVVQRPTPFTFDLGLLLVNDPNPVSLPQSDPEATETTLASAARDGAQALINQLLTTCAVKSSADGVHLVLPPPVIALPREKPVPKARPPTRWETFAARHGIQPKMRDARRNKVFDENRQEWRSRWGRHGANKDAERDWLVEVDPQTEKKAAESGASVRSLSRRDRLEVVRKNQKRQLRNTCEASQLSKTK